MPSTSAPFKTPLGQEELRLRTLKLGPRHRTVLLLVDGRRRQKQVLELAGRAGCPPKIFDELVALGLIELPVSNRVVAEVELLLGDLAEEAAEALDTAPLLPDAAMPLYGDIVMQPTAPQTVIPILADAVDIPVLSDIVAADPVPPADDEESPATMPAPFDDGGIDIPIEDAADTGFAPLPDELPPAAIPETVPMAIRRDVPSVEDVNEQEMRELQRVRDLLCETLRFNAPIFSARTLIRVRLAKSRRELIGLVWEIEQHLQDNRRARGERSGWEAVEAARDLLGMGNTHVAGESRFEWPDTQGGANSQAWPQTRPQR